MQPSSVDFPAPFGPIKQVSEPGATRTVTSSTAATAPKDLPAPRASHAAPVTPASVIQSAPYWPSLLSPS